MGLCALGIVVGRRLDRGDLGAAWPAATVLADRHHALVGSICDRRPGAGLTQPVHSKRLDMGACTEFRKASVSR